MKELNAQDCKQIAGGSFELEMDTGARDGQGSSSLECKVKVCVGFGPIEICAGF
ncbi:MAG: hypothetical protein ABJA83_11145 [Burkholderiaceae bacterium]